MLKDDLKKNKKAEKKLSIKEQIAADMAKETDGMSIKDKIAADIAEEAKAASVADKVAEAILLL